LFRSQAMGLVERRATEEFKTRRLPALVEEITAAAGIAIPVEVAWDKLALPEQAHLYSECWEQVYFRPLIDARKGVAIDDLGREALRAGLKKVSITNGGEIYYGDRMATFADGVLTLDHQPTTNVSDVRDRTDGIRKVLENGL